MIKVLVAERNQMIRYGIQSALEPMPGCRIIAEASSTQQLLWCLGSIDHDILLIEAHFLDELGLQLFEEFSIGVSPPRMIVHGTQDPTEGVIALRNGARGYLMSRCSAAELREAISQVAAGKRYIDGTLAEELASFLSVSPNALPCLLLTREEFRIHKMLVLGLSLDGIAAQVNMSLQAVRKCKERIRAKLELDGIAELIHATPSPPAGPASFSRPRPGARASSSRPAHPAAPGYSPGPG